MALVLKAVCDCAAGCRCGKHCGDWDAGGFWVWDQAARQWVPAPDGAYVDDPGDVDPDTLSQPTVCDGCWEECHAAGERPWVEP
jgi:hypothetical protein